MSYAYCEKCDRPLLDYQCKTSVVGVGEHRRVSRICKFCFASALRPLMILDAVPPLHCGVGIISVSALFFLAGDATPSVDGVVAFLLLGLLAAPLLIVGKKQKSKCKPIYDRWVMQHGNDPDKWPDATKPE